MGSQAQRPENQHHIHAQSIDFHLSCWWNLLPERHQISRDGAIQGNMFYSARWNHSYDYTGKRMAANGNGCSAAQIVPKVAEKAAFGQQ
jgi:hypothetical protein